MPLYCSVLTVFPGEPGPTLPPKVIATCVVELAYEAKPARPLAVFKFPPLAQVPAGIPAAVP